MSTLLTFEDCRIRFIHNPRIRAFVLGCSNLTRDELLKPEFRYVLRSLVVRFMTEVSKGDCLISIPFEDITMWTDDLGVSRIATFRHLFVADCNLYV